MHDHALTDDAHPQPAAIASHNVDPLTAATAAPATPADRLDAVAALLAEGLRRVARQVGHSRPSIEHQEDSPSGLELAEHAGPDGSRG